MNHTCGWTGPKWLHIAGLCATCKGWAVRRLDGSEASPPRPPCEHPKCAAYRGAS